MASRMVKTVSFPGGNVNAYRDAGVQQRRTEIQVCIQTGGEAVVGLTHYFTEAGARAYASALLQCADAVAAAREESASLPLALPHGDV